MSIGKWFEQAGKDIGKFVTKEIPKFVTKTIPSVGKPETFRPSLIPLRKEKENLRSRLTAQRSSFFDDRAKLAQKTTRYRALSEDYARKAGEKASRTKIKVIKETQWDEPANAAEKTWQDVDKSVRAVCSSATFGLTEPLWAVTAAVRAKEEVDFLKKRNAALSKVIKSISDARSKMQKASADLDASIQELSKLDATVAELATERNQTTLDDARHNAIETMARRLLEDGTSAEQVEMLTGLTQEKIAALAATAAEVK